MDEIRVIDIQKSIFDDNNLEAERLRSDLREKKTYLLNVMSSPGAGKTTTILRTLEYLKGSFRVGVLEADIDSVVDAEKIQKAGGTALQLHTGGMCHLDAGMTRTGLEAFQEDPMDLVILENVGNLVCPAEFDTGASGNIMILSVPEGDDKPLKYPLMFTVCDALLINKTDCMDYFDFDIQAAKERALSLNPDLKIFEISAKTGEGFEPWISWLSTEVRKWNG